MNGAQFPVEEWPVVSQASGPWTDRQVLRLPIPSQPSLLPMELRVETAPGMGKVQEVPDTPCSRMAPDTLFLDQHSVASG